MLGVIHSLDDTILTMLIQECCCVRLERYWLNGVKTMLEVGSKVWYEREIYDYRLIPRLTRIEKYYFENCNLCGQAHEPTDAQVVSLKTLISILTFYCFLIKYNIAT